ERLTLESLDTSHNIDHAVDELSKYDNIGKMLELGRITQVDGRFISSEAFEFMAWILGEEEVNIETM
ncbi:19264_t:CDS:1, partial [Funneliformis geosporum]